MIHDSSVIRRRGTRLAASVFIIALTLLIAGQSRWPRAAAQPLPDAPAPPLMLPTMNHLGALDVCRSWVSVQNVGTRDTTAVLVVWGPAPGGSICLGPLKAECSGLIAPGSSWRFIYPQIPSGSSSGFVYSFDPYPFEDPAVSGLRPDLMAGYACETVFFGTVGDCDAFTEFHEAYMSGGTFQGISMIRAIGAPVVATVLRHCPADLTPGAEASSSYQAIPLVPSAMGAADLSGYTATSFSATASEDRAGPFASVQSAAPEGTSVEVSVRAAGSTSVWTPCLQFDAFLGETTPLDLSVCMEPGVPYAVRAASAFPVALVLEQAADNTFTAVEGFFPGDPIDAVGRPVLGPMHRAFGPFVGAGQGWTSTLAVHVPGTVPADVTVTWMLVGAPPATETRRVCADCLETFTLESGLGGGTIGSVQVESSGVGDTEAPRIDASITSRNVGAPPNEAAFAYALVPNSLMSESSLAGAMGLPFGLRDSRNTGTTSSTALARPAGPEEPARVALHYFNTNDVMSAECIDLPQAGYAMWVAENSTLPHGSTGAGVITVETGAGTALAAADLVLTGTTGEAIPGDELAVSLASSLLVKPSYTAWPAEPCIDFATPVRPDQVAPFERSVTARSANRLPTIGYQGQDNVCASVITVRNTGSEPMFAILVTWAEPGFCPPQCAGPLHIALSEPIAPDTTWEFDPIEDAASGIVYGAKALSMDDVGAIPGGPEPAAAVLKDALFLEAMGDCDDMRRFEVAWAGGDSFLDVPLGPLATDTFTVDVARDCTDLWDEDANVQTAYRALSSERFDTLSTAPGRRIQSVTPVTTEEQTSTVVYLQNAGARCTSVTLTWRTYGDWDDAFICSVFALAPGETYPFGSSCTPSEWHGSVVIESEEPLAVVTEILQPGLARIVTSRSRANPFDLDGDGDVDTDDILVLESALGSEPGHKMSVEFVPEGQAPRWNELADLDADRRVTLADRQILIDNLDKGVVPPPTPTDEPGPTPTDLPVGWTIYLPFTTTTAR